MADEPTRPADEQQALDEISRAIRGGVAQSIKGSALLMTWGVAAVVISQIAWGDQNTLALWVAASPALAALVDKIGGDILASLIDRVIGRPELTPDEIRELLADELRRLPPDAALTPRQFFQTVGRMEEKADARQAELLALLELLRAELAQRQPLAQAGTRVASSKSPATGFFGLSSDDFDRLVRILAAMPDFRAETSRINFLDHVFAGLPCKGDVLSQLNLSGAPREVAVHVVTRLTDFGQYESGEETLGVLINGLLRYRGGGDDADFLHDLFKRYPLTRLGRKRPEAVQKKTSGPAKPLPESPVTAKPQPEPTEPLSEPIIIPEPKPELIDKGLSPQEYFQELLPVPKDNPRYYLAAFLVSNELYMWFVKANPSWHPAEGTKAQKLADNNYLRHWRNGQPREGELDLPVTHISVHAAEAFAAWLGGITRTDVRLPTLKEWTLAVQAGRDHWFTEELNAGRINYFDTSNKLQPVKAFDPNPFGIHDLLGNAYDMCVDGDGETAVHYLTGGCYYNSEAELRAKVKAPSKIESKTACFIDASFRCVYSNERNLAFENK